MANSKGFVKTVQEMYGMRPVFPIGTTVEIGDIGTIGSDGSWNPISKTKARFRVEPTGVRRAKHGKAIWDATSGDDVSLKVYADGKTSKLIENVADAKLRTEFSFKSSKSFAFATRDVTIAQASEFDDVLMAIRRAYHKRNELPENRRWEKNYAFVFAVGDSRNLTTLLAESANTDVAVTGKAKVGPPQTVADLSAGVRIGISSKEIQKQEHARAPRAFFRAYRLNPAVFRGWDRERLEEVGESGFGPFAGEKTLTPAQVRALEKKPLPSAEQAFKEA